MAKPIQNMVRIQSTYIGELRTKNIHGPSGVELITDAPTDNHGRGEAFSPTDLVATAYADCMITIMGIKARDLDVDLTGTTYEITKVMYSDPRRIGEIHVRFDFPDREYAQKHKTILERIQETCPVAHSIHPEIKRIVTFNWKK